jgi:hypothetical protein
VNRKLAEIAGKEGVGTFSGELEDNKSRFHMENGDKAHYRYQGTTVLKNGAPQSEEGTWSLIRGTSKLKGITGKGTYKGSAGADGTMTYEVQDEYQTSAKVIVEDLAASIAENSQGWRGPALRWVPVLGTMPGCVPPGSSRTGSAI